MNKHFEHYDSIFDVPEGLPVKITFDCLACPVCGAIGFQISGLVVATKEVLWDMESGEVSRRFDYARPLLCSCATFVWLREPIMEDAYVLDDA